MFQAGAVIKFSNSNYNSLSITSAPNVIFNKHKLDTLLTNRNTLLCSKQGWRRQAHVAWWPAIYLQSIKGPKHCLWFCTR